MHHRLAVGLVTGVVAAAIGVRGTAAQTTTTAPPPTTTAACPQPYEPVYETGYYYGFSPLPTIEIDLEETVDLTRATEDLDGDGTDDLRVNDDRVRIVRPGGDTVLTVPGARLDVTSTSDLDGDGNREVWIFEYAQAGPDPSPDDAAVAAAWVVPWSAPLGTFDPAAVGVTVPPGIPWSIGDRDADGVDEVLSISHLFGFGLGTTTLMSGASVLAGGAPGDVIGDPAHEVHPGAAIALAELGETRPAVVILEQPIAPTDPAAPVYELEPLTIRVVLDDEVIELTSGPGEPPHFSEQSVYASTSPSGRFLLLSRGGRNQGGNLLWSLDDPCTRLQAAPTTTTVPLAPPPTAPPAAPTQLDPTYTG